MKLRPKVTAPDPEAADICEDAELLDRLNRIHGVPWVLDDRSQITHLNSSWWAGLYRWQRHILFDEDEGNFWQFGDDGVYETVGEDRILTDLDFFLVRALRTLDLPLDDRLRPMRRLRDIVSFLRGVASVREPFHFNREKPLVAVANGVLELTPGGVRFSRFSPQHLVRSKAPVRYNAKARCPRFVNEFLDPMLSDEEDRDLLIRHLGLILLGQNPAQRMGILEGEGGAGKTVLINLITALVGEDHAIQLRTEHLRGQFELDALRGRTLLLGADVDEDFLNTMGASTLKGLVSNDLYHPEAKNRRDRRPLRGPFNCLVGTNAALTYRAQGDASAWRRRLIIYPCRKPDGRKRVQNFERVLLREEGAGIVNLLIGGLERALLEIDATGDLVLSETQEERIERLILRSDPLDAFVTRCLLSSEEEDVTSTELLEGYVSFCHARGWRPLAEDTFFRRLSPLISERFGVAQVHRIERVVAGKPRLFRGWRGLTFQDSDFVPTRR